MTALTLKAGQKAMDEIRTDLEEIRAQVKELAERLDSIDFRLSLRAERMLTIPEAAEVMGMSRQQAYNLIRERGLPAFRYGGGGAPYRVRLSDLRGWLDKQEAELPEEG